jgi:HlyD family secretion protein
VAGTVTEVRVREGDRVEAGDTLLVLDDREALAGLREAEATFAQTGASSQQSIDEAEREALQARRDLERIRAVFETGGLTLQRLEQAEQRAADASSRFESLRAQGGSSGRGGEPAAIARARAALEAARARLALTRITAPAEGTILTRSVEPGDAASPGRILLEMAFGGPMEGVAFPGEENLGELGVGAPATVSADAFPSRVLSARVELVAPAVDPTQGTVEVRLILPDAPDFLRSGMTVSVNIEAGRRPAAKVLPEVFVQGLGAGEAWVAVIREGRLARQPVEAGLREGGFVEILAGVGEHERVVAAGEAEVGDRVRARAADGG